MENLFSIDKNSLSHAQFGDISRLSSVANLDYQVCNGGVAQYFDNGYDCYREPYNEQDVACEARDMRDGKDAFASTEQENVQGLRDCNR